MIDAATHRFADTRGRTWTFEVNTFTAYRLKNETGFDLLTLTSGGCEKLGDDFYLLFDVMVSLLQDQHRQAGVTTEDFGRSMDEVTTADAVQALFRAFADFSRGPKAKVFRAAIERADVLLKRREAEAIAAAEKAIADGTIDRMILRELDGSSSSG